MTTALDSNLVKCTKCKALLFPGIFNLGGLTPCPSCGKLLEIEVFPAALAEHTVTLPEAILVEGESSCFYHPAKKATIVCESCGRFLCALCDLDLNGRHVCPTCLESGQKKSKFKDLENTRLRYDSIALALAVLPLLTLWLTIFGAPAALYVAIRYWKAPCSIVGRSRWMFIVAGVLALAEIAGWVIGISYAVTHK